SRRSPKASPMPQRLPLLSVLIVLPLLAGCGDLPDLNGRADPAAQAAAYPVILPLGPTLAAAQGGISARTTEEIAATGAATQARADALRSRQLVPGGDETR